MSCIGDYSLNVVAVFQRSVARRGWPYFIMGWPYSNYPFGYLSFEILINTVSSDTLAFRHLVRFQPFYEGLGKQIEKPIKLLIDLRQDAPPDSTDIRMFGCTIFIR